MTFPEQLKNAKLAVIDTGTKAVYKAFKGLYMHRDFPVAYLRCRESEVSSALALCEQEGVFAMVMGAKEVLLPQKPFTAALIAPSASLQPLYVRKIINTSSLTDFSVLAHQIYLTPPADLEHLKKRYFETLRLGALREDMSLAEPLLRDADYVWFDICAVRAADAPQVKNPEPNGLYAEEACKLIHYVGLSNNTKVLFLHGYNTFLHSSSLTARLTAQLMWHLIEGLMMRIKENLSMASDNLGFKEIMVDMGVKGQELVFLYSMKTRRWWVKVIHNETDITWVPCSHGDYQTACKGEIPTRWLWYHQKFNY